MMPLPGLAIGNEATGPRPPRRLIIVDDEDLGRLNLRCAVADHADWQTAGEFASVSAAREYLRGHDIDLILLDIHLPQEGGLALARELCRMAQPPLIVFVTAYDVHAIKAFEVHALDYLLKPFDDARLATALQRADAMLAQRQRAAHGAAVRRFFDDQSSPAAATPYWSQINVRSVGRIECILLTQVLWIAAAGNYVELHLRERTVLYRIPIGRLEAHLDPAAFVRTHRGFMVRIDQCAALSGPADAATLRLQCGATVPVSEQFVQRIRHCLDTR